MAPQRRVSGSGLTVSFEYHWISTQGQKAQGVCQGTGMGCKTEILLDNAGTPALQTKACKREDQIFVPKFYPRNLHGPQTCVE